MELPPLTGISEKQIQYGRDMRTMCLRAWKAEPERASMTDAEVQRLLAITDASWWIASGQKKRTLAKVLAWLRSNPAESVASAKKPTAAKRHKHDDSHDIVVFTEGGFKRIGPLRNRYTGEIVPENEDTPF